MNKIAATLALAATFSVHGSPQLGLEYKQNNSAFSLWIEVVNLSSPSGVSVYLDGQALAIENTPITDGVLVADMAHLPGTDAGLDIQPGDHFVSLGLTVDGTTSFYNGLASFTVLPFSDSSEADFDGLTDLYGVVHPVYTFYDIQTDASSTDLVPDSGETLFLALLSLGAVSLLRRRGGGTVGMKNCGRPGAA